MITNIQVNLPSSYIPYENLEPNEEFHKSYLDSLPLVGCLQLPGMFLILILAQKTWQSTGIGLKIVTFNHFYQQKTKHRKINQIQPKIYMLVTLHNYSSSESPSLEYPPPPLLQPETLLMLLTLEIPPGRSKWATLLISCRLLPLELVGGVVGHIIVGLDRWRWWWWSTPPLVEPDPVAPTLEVLVLNGATELCLQNRKI